VNSGCLGGPPPLLPREPMLSERAPQLSKLTGVLYAEAWWGSLCKLLPLFHLGLASFIEEMSKTARSPVSTPWRWESLPLAMTRLFSSPSSFLASE
jgi:hypothetical protein